MTSPTLCQCDGCELVVPFPEHPCPGCGETTTYSRVTAGEIDWTAEAKEVAHRFANELVDSDDFDMCLRAFLTQVMTPLNQGEDVPGVIQRHYVNQMISVAAISVYARLLGIDVHDLRLDSDQMEEAVESLMSDLAEQGYEGTARWRETENGDAILATFPDGLELTPDAPGAREILDCLRKGTILTGLSPEKRGEIQNLARKAGITTTFTGYHDDLGGWIGTTPLEEALASGRIEPDPAGMANIIIERPRMIEEFLIEDSTELPGGPYPEALAETIQVLLERGKMIVGLPADLYEDVLEVCRDYEVQIQAGTRDVGDRILRWIAGPDSDIEEKLEAWTELLS